MNKDEKTLMNDEYKDVFLRLLKGNELTLNGIETFDVWHQNTSLLEREKFYRSLSGKTEMNELRNCFSDFAALAGEVFEQIVAPIGAGVRVEPDAECEALAMKFSRALNEVEELLEVQSTK